MAVSEFELIRRYFVAATRPRTDVLLGIGDDCALLQPPPGVCLAVSMDTLVEGRHFSAGCDPEALGHKALAVNLSDLAAAGARPAWATMSLTLPAADTAWLDGFMRGFSALAARHEVQLVGGDTTRGPLSITVQVHGFADPATALRRSTARAGERLFVSGMLGDAGLALAELQRGDAAAALDPALLVRLDRPQPRVALGLALAGVASAAIDVSDGLLADLGHVCAASGVGAVVELARLPLSPAVAASAARGDWHHPLAGGDDYELLFAMAPDRVVELPRLAEATATPIQEIGRLVDEPGITLVYPDGHQSKELPRGFDHFRD